MKIKTWSVVFIMSTLSFYVACEDDNDDNSQMYLAQSDIDNLNSITQDNLAQIEWSKVVADSGSNNRLLAFALQLSTEHQLSQNQIDSIANAFNAVLLKKMDTIHLRIRDTLRNRVRGRNFDTLYMGEQIRLHNSIINHLSNAYTNGINTQVRNMANIRLQNAIKNRDTAMAIKDRL